MNKALNYQGRPCAPTAERNLDYAFHAPRAAPQQTSDVSCDKVIDDMIGTRRIIMQIDTMTNIRLDVRLERLQESSDFSP